MRSKIFESVRRRISLSNSRTRLALAVAGLIVIGVSGLLLSKPALAATGINQQLNFQGRLLNSAGAIVADGTYNMRFKIYQDGDGCVSSGSSPCSGTLKWTETRQNSASQGVTVRNGYFSVALGSVTAFGSSVDWNQDTLWLSMDVAGTGTGGSPTYDGEMLPFRRLTAAPYALQAGSAANCTSCIVQAPTSTAQNTITPTTNSVVGLTVNATSGTAATALAVVQSQAADGLTVTANSLTSGSALKVTSANNTAANTAWSAVQLNVSNLQGTTAVSTGSIAGFDVQFTQNAGIAGNTETVANLVVKQINTSVTDNTVSSILNLANNDTATGNQITVTDGLKISGANITNGINLSGTFGTNLITSSNFSVSQAGAIVGVGVNSGTGLIQGTGGLTVTGVTSINDNTNSATNINTGSSNALVSIGGGSGTFALNTNNIDISSGGAITGATGVALASGNFSQAGAGTFGTGTGTVSLNGDTAIAAGKNLSLASGAGTFGQIYTGTSTDAHTITASSLTTAAALKVTSSNNSAANSAWSAVSLNVSNLQGTTAVSTGTISGLDLQFTQNTAVSGNTETVANLAVAQNNSATSDATISSILNLANNDTATGNQITVTDGLKINGANVTNGLNLSGTFGTNLITSSNFTVTQGGAITAGSYQGSAVGVQYGGTGVSSTTAYGLLAGGTTSTGAFQNIGTGSSGQILQSNGAGALPSWVGAGVCSTCVAQVPTTTAQNTITPTTNSVVALTVNATSGTSAAGTIINQSQTADTLQINTANTSGTQTNGIIFNRNGSSGTTTNGLNITQTAGTLTNGLAFTGTIGTDITRGSGTLTLQGNGGIALKSTSGNIVLGTSDTTGTLLVLDDKTDSGDPTAVDGAMYYNSNAEDFRCAQAGAWVSCLGGKLTTNTAASNGNSSTSAAAFTFASFTPTIPANYCVTGRVIHITMTGQIDNISGSTRTMSVTVRLGSTAISTVGTTPIVSAGGTATWTLHYYMTCTSAPSSSASFISQGWMGSGSSYVGLASASNTFDSTTAQTINLYGAMSGNLCTASIQQFIVESL